MSACASRVSLSATKSCEARGPLENLFCLVLDTAFNGWDRLYGIPEQLKSVIALLVERTDPDFDQLKLAVLHFDGKEAFNQEGLSQCQAFFFISVEDLIVFLIHDSSEELVIIIHLAMIFQYFLGVVGHQDKALVASFLDVTNLGHQSAFD